MSGIVAQSRDAFGYSVTKTAFLHQSLGAIGVNESLFFIGEHLAMLPRPRLDSLLR